MTDEEVQIVNLTGEPITFLVAGSPPTQMTVKSHGIFTSHEEKETMDVGGGTSVYTGRSTYKTFIELHDPRATLKRDVTVVVKRDDIRAARFYTHELKGYKVVCPGKTNTRGVVTEFSQY